MFRKILIILLTFNAIYYTSSVYASEISLKKLNSADSLFQKKHYTESLELYEQLNHSGYYTPRMLIRLSLINEGLGNYTYALYYLNIYYSNIHDRTVLKKMDELAERHNLEGYDYNDLVFFISIYEHYYNYILLAFLITSVLFLVYLYILKAQKKKMGLKPLLFILILAAVYALSNYTIFPEKAIIANNTSLMSAPSSGSELIGYLNKGHRVTIRDHIDIWYEIKWHDKIAYVRADNLLFVEHNTLHFK